MASGVPRKATPARRGRPQNVARGMREGGEAFDNERLEGDLSTLCDHLRGKRRHRLSSTLKFVLESSQEDAVQDTFPKGVRPDNN